MSEQSRLIGDFARIDTDRQRRRGYPEAIFCEGKTVDQVRAIAANLIDQNVIFTRCSPTQLHAIQEELPGVFIDELARFAAWPQTAPEPSGVSTLIVCAGTSDLPVAREALHTLRFLGREAQLLADVGVAGIHRLLEHEEKLQQAGVIVVVAGMDGALPSVVGGLVSAPVVAVPTSVGYGAGAGGIAPLLTMLNSCAPGVGVVNIDNGYGAGHLAAQIAAR